MSELAAAPHEESAASLEYDTDMPVGEILRRTRLYYGQSLFEVEAALRIRASHLDAIEKAEVERLPGRVYALGFVRSYAEYLGLDPDAMVRLFKVQGDGAGEKPELHFLVSAEESRTPNLYAVLGALTGAVAVIAIWAALYAPRHTPEPIPLVPQELQAAVLEAEDTPVPDRPLEQAIAPVTGTEVESLLPPKPIVLKITTNSWVEIRNAEGAAILRRILKPGDIYTVPEDAGELVMSTGNAGGIDIVLDGENIGPLGPPAAVRRNITLKPGNLRSIVETKPPQIP